MNIIADSPWSLWEDATPSRAADTHTFREAMSRFGAAVHVVTTAGHAGKAGFTATAVTSVSDNPPTLLVCLNRQSRITPILSANGVFCVNTLAANEEGIANVFAGRTGLYAADRFKHGEWGILETGAPALASAIAVIDCRVLEMKSVATHDIYFGNVAAIRLGATPKALVYHARVYKEV